MVNYTVSLKVDDDDVAKLNEAGYKLCFATGVDAVDDAFTVVASCDIITANADISWTDEYQIVASREQYWVGVNLSVSNTPSDICFKQKFTHPENWTRGKIEDDRSLEDGTFKFVNQAREKASAVVYLKIRGVATPVYICPAYIFAEGGTVELTPKKEIALWVQKNVETGTMISEKTSPLARFDMANRTTLSVKWSKGESKFVEN